MEAFVFLTAGGLYRRFEPRLSFLRRWYVAVGAAVIYGTVLTLLPERIMALIAANEINLPGMVMGIYASVLLITLCKLIPKISVLDYVGQNSLVFYLLSGALPITGSMIMDRLFPKKTLFGLCIVFFASLLLAAAVSWVIGQFLPWLLDLCKLRVRSPNAKKV